MKKIILFSAGIIIFVVLSILCYGFYLNYTNEKNIAINFASQKASFVAVKSREGKLFTRWIGWPIKLHAQKQADVVSRNSGVLSKIFVEQGQIVEEGQILAKVVSEEIDTKLVELDAQLARTRTIRDKYKITYARYEKLKDTGAVSMEQYDSAKAEYFGYVEEVKAIEAQKHQYELMFERLDLKAPFAGKVMIVYKKIGSYLDAGVPVMMIADFSKLQFYDEETTDFDLKQLEPLDQELRLYLADTELKKVYSPKYSPGNDLYSNFSNKSKYTEGGWNKYYKVHITNITPPVGQKAEQRSVTYEVDNLERELEPRNYQSAVLTTTVLQHGVLVPFSALDGDMQNIMVENKDGIIEKRQVEIGAFDDSTKIVLIKNGLAAGEIVLEQYNEEMIGNKKISFMVKEW